MKKITSIKTKLLAAFGFSMLITAIAIATLTRIDVINHITQGEEQEAKNILKLTTLSISNEYKDLLHNKESALKSRKEHMQEIANLIMTDIKGYYNLAKKGIISEENAKKTILSKIRKIRYGNNYYFTVFDKDFTAISHPDQKFMGKNLSNTKDADGRYVTKETTKLAQNGGGFYTYRWKKLNDDKAREKLGYYLYFKPWKWKLGTGLYIDDIENEANKRLEELKKQLEKTLAKVKISENGYIYVANGDGKIIVAPKVIKPVRKPIVQMDKNLFAKVKQYSKTGERFLYTTADGRVKEFYIIKIDSLNWYVAASVYQEDIQKAAKKLATRQLVVILIMFIIGFIITYMGIIKISRPLVRLTKYTDNFVENGFSHSKEDASIANLAERSDEIGHLAKSFFEMEKNVAKHVSTLESKVVALEIKIDEEKKAEHVKQITESDFFSDILKAADDLKKST